jgi:SAM-dependent methyltransferase
MPMQRVVTRHVYGGSAEHAFFHCSACDVRYLHPQLGAEDQERFYVQEFSAFMAGRSGASGAWEIPERHVAANQAQQLRRQKYLMPALPTKPGRILEIGCSSGFMLYPLLEQGHECVAIEPSGAFASYVRNRGVTCYESFEQLLASGSANGGFDVIMHFFVLEHISEAESFLQGQLKLLRPGGKLVIEVPNAADALASVYDIPAFERFYWSIAHSWYFSESSLRHLLKQLGHPFEIVLDQRYDLSNHMIWARDGRPGGMGRFTERLGSTIEEAYKAALVRAKLCDTLIGIVTV